MYSRKGLSDIVTNVLIILLVLVAVGVIAAFVLPVIRQTSTVGDESSSYTLQFDIPLGSVFVNQTSKEVFLTIHRQAGEGELQGFRIILTNDQGNSETNSSYENYAVAELESVNVRVHYNLPGNITQVTVIPLIKTADGVALGKQIETIPINPAGRPTGSTSGSGSSGSSGGNNGGGSNDPFCGDGIVDSDAGEECEPGQTQACVLVEGDDQQGIENTPGVQTCSNDCGWGMCQSPPN